METYHQNWDIKDLKRGHVTLNINNKLEIAQAQLILNEKIIIAVRFEKPNYFFIELSKFEISENDLIDSFLTLMTPIGNSILAGVPPVVGDYIDWDINSIISERRFFYIQDKSITQNTIIEYSLKISY